MKRILTICYNDYICRSPLKIDLKPILVGPAILHTYKVHVHEQICNTFVSFVTGGQILLYKLFKCCLRH